MQVISLHDALKIPGVRSGIVKAMRSGDVLVYPTDTIYGVGCNAENAGSVRRISDAKGREETKGFSVIAPSKEWIWSHAAVSDHNRKFIDTMLPGPYTVVVSARDSAPRAAVSPEKTLGIRIPRHPFAEVISEAGIPFITTSVNLSGQAPATSLDMVPDEIRKITSMAIDAGTISGDSSRVFDLRTDNVKILRY
jgi:L-threonylcarbamoyladenylate synthase